MLAGEALQKFREVCRVVATSGKRSDFDADFAEIDDNNEFKSTYSVHNLYKNLISINLHVGLDDPAKYLTGFVVEADEDFASIQETLPAQQKEILELFFKEIVYKYPKFNSQEEYLSVLFGTVVNYDAASSSRNIMLKKAFLYDIFKFLSDHINDWSQYKDAVEISYHKPEVQVLNHLFFLGLKGLDWTSDNVTVISNNIKLFSSADYLQHTLKLKTLQAVALQLRDRNNVQVTQEKNVEVFDERNQKAFDAQFIDVDGTKLVDDWIKYVNSAATYTRKTRFLSPCVPIIQRSMVGKSRLIKEAAKRHWTFYVCLRGSTEAGYPKQSPAIADWFTKIEITATHESRLASVKFMAFYVACIESLTINMSKENAHPLSPEDWFKQQENYGTNAQEVGLFWAKIKGRAENIAGDILKAFKIKAIKNGIDVNTVSLECLPTYISNEDCLNCLKSTCGSYMADFKKIFMAKDWLQRKRKFHNMDTERSDIIYFVFDEAGALLNKDKGSTNRLQILRDAASIKYEFPRLNLAMVVMDTISSISNFAPTAQNIILSSYRASKGTELYEPYWVV